MITHCYKVMRLRRIKRTGVDTVYHCMSRTTGGEFLFGHEEKIKMIDIMHRTAEFCGVEVLNYVMMDNHYHILGFVPSRQVIDNEEIIRRYKVLYGEKALAIRGLEQTFAKKDHNAERERQRILKQMGDLSVFQQIYKQTVSRWFNKVHNRKGTLWMERFKAQIVEDSAHALSHLSSYITLNPVRANMTDDPAAYPYSAFHAALKGDNACRMGLKKVMNKETWMEALDAFRLWLIEVSETGKETESKRGMPASVIQKMIKAGKKLPLDILLLNRARYFIDTVAIGTADFIEEIFNEFRSYFSPNRKKGAQKIPGLNDDSLCVMRSLRKDPIGVPD